MRNVIQSQSPPVQSATIATHNDSHHDKSFKTLTPLEAAVVLWREIGGQIHQERVPRSPQLEGSVVPHQPPCLSIQNFPDLTKKDKRAAEKVALELTETEKAKEIRERNKSRQHLCTFKKKKKIACP